MEFELQVLKDLEQMEGSKVDEKYSKEGLYSQYKKAVVVLKEKGYVTGAIISDYKMDEEPAIVSLKVAELTEKAEKLLSNN